MAKFELNVNGKATAVDVSPDTPVLWVLRDSLGLVGTKYGCGIAQCGACTVHVDGKPIRSCTFPVSAVRKSRVVTIEGLSADGTHPVQQAWLEEDVPQCGYCQAGQIMQVVTFLESNPTPTDSQIDVAMAGNLCRCGSYKRIRKAIHKAAQLKAGKP